MNTNNIDTILSSLDGISRAEAKPYMHTRIHARMSNAEQLSVWDKAIYFISRPAVIAASVILFLGLNALSLVNIGSEETENDEAIATVSNNVKDYSTINNIYDLENTEP